MNPAKDNLENRISRFPGPESHGKRKLTDVESGVQIAKEKFKLQKRPTVQKTAEAPWERYRKSFSLNQAGCGQVVHANDSSFREGIIKTVNTTRSELSRIISSPHKNLVHLQEAFYHNDQIFLLYEIMDISLAQLFTTPFGSLQLFEVAAFSKELLIGIHHIHDSLKITHGQINSENILLSVAGVIKIGRESLQC
jgi:serine/threonine protein kinase